MEEIYVEPTEKVIKALKTAMETLGRNRFIVELNLEDEKLNKWINGVEWIPLRVLYETCRINLRFNKPYNRLSDTIEGATVISKRETRETAKTEAIVKKIEEERIPVEKEVEKELEEKRKRVFMYLMSRSMVLLMLMLPLALIGYVIGARISGFYAGVGMVIGVLIWLIIVTVYIILKPIKYK